MTINEGLEMLALLKTRIAELNSLRKENTVRDTYYSGSDRSVLEVKEPMYDIKKVDKLISKLAKEQRLLQSAIKKTNAVAEIKGFESKKLEDFDLGELEDFEREVKEKK